LFARLNELPASAGYRAIALSGIGHSDYQSRDFTGAAAAFGKLVSEVPSEKPELTADAAFMRGVSLDAAGNKPEAAKAYSDGALLLAGSNGKITTAPSDAKVGRNAYRCARGAGRAYAEAGDVVAADAAYTDAWLLIQALPDDKASEADKLLNEWALVNYGADRFARSDELFRKLLAEHADSSYADDARHYLAESRLQDGKFEDARKEFQALLDDPKAGRSQE
jgi:TolA-binding protein